MPKKPKRPAVEIHAVRWRQIVLDRIRRFLGFAPPQFPKNGPVDLHPSGGVPIAFVGSLVSSVRGPDDARAGGALWFDLYLYRADDRSYIAVIMQFAQARGATPYLVAERLPGPDAVVQFFRGFDPGRHLPEVLGRALDKVQVDTLRSGL